MSTPAGLAGFDPRSLAPLDIAGLIIVALLIVLGLWRGLWWQVIRLAGIVAAVVLARAFAPELAAWILGRWTDLPQRVAHGIAWFSVFLAGLLVAMLLGLLGQRLIQAMQLGLVNRLGGGLLGALSGFLLHVALLVVLCQLAPEPFVGRVVAGTYSEKLVETVGQRWEVVIDGDAAREIERLLGGDDAPPEGDASESGL